MGASPLSVGVHGDESFSFSIIWTLRVSINTRQRKHTGYSLKCRSFVFKAYLSSEKGIFVIPWLFQLVLVSCHRVFGEMCRTYIISCLSCLQDLTLRFSFSHKTPAALLHSSTTAVLNSSVKVICRKRACLSYAFLIMVYILCEK